MWKAIGSLAGFSVGFVFGVGFALASLIFAAGPAYGLGIGPFVLNGAFFGLPGLFVGFVWGHKKDSHLLWVKLEGRELGE